MKFWKLASWIFSVHEYDVSTTNVAMQEMNIYLLSWIWRQMSWTRRCFRKCLHIWHLLRYQVRGPSSDNRKHPSRKFQMFWLRLSWGQLVSVDNPKVNQESEIAPSWKKMRVGFLLNPDFLGGLGKWMQPLINSSIPNDPPGFLLGCFFRKHLGGETWYSERNLKLLFEAAKRRRGCLSQSKCAALSGPQIKQRRDFFSVSTCLLFPTDHDNVPAVYTWS